MADRRQLDWLVHSIISHNVLYFNSNYASVNRWQDDIDLMAYIQCMQAAPASLAVPSPLVAPSHKKICGFTAST